VRRIYTAICCLALLACDTPVEVVQEVTVVQVPTVDVRVAELHRFADLVLVNEVEIWTKLGYTCEVKYVWTETEPAGDGVVLILQKELHLCWKVTYETVRQVR